MMPNATPNHSFRAHIAIPLALLLLPLVVFGDTIFHRFGFRDDYSITREAGDEPAKLMAVFGAQGRPVYGWLLQVSAAHTPDIGDFWSLRLAGAAGLGLLAAGCYLVLRGQGWRCGLAALAAALLVLLPSGQIIAGWGICWPHTVAAGLGLAAFAAAERGRTAGGWGGRGAWLAAAAAGLALGALDYQCGVLFYLAGVAGGLGARLADVAGKPVRWLAFHAAVLGAGMLLAFDATNWLYATGVYRQSDRVAIDLHLPAKLGLYFRDALPNILALFVLNDEEGRMALPHAAASLAVLTLLLAGGLWLLRRRGAPAATLWLASVAGLPLAAYGVSLIAAEHWVTYRTLYPAAAVVLVLSITALDWLLPGRARFRLAVLAALMLVAAGAARWQAYHLIALPQALELRLLEAGARAIDPARHPSILVLTPNPTMAPAPMRWADEFGSLSMDSDWTPKEALKHIMRERFPRRPDLQTAFTYASSGRIAPGTDPDVVINLRAIAAYRGKVD